MVGARAEVACSGRSTADRDGDQVATVAAALQRRSVGTAGPESYSEVW